MKKNKKVVILLIVCFLIISGFIFIKTWKKPYTKADYDSASLQEKEKLDYFYEGSIPISKGKHFDMRYLYYDGKCLGNIQIEAVKKVEENIAIDEITIYNEKGTKILFESLSEDSFLNPEFPKKEKGKANIIRSVNNDRYYGRMHGGLIFYTNYVAERDRFFPSVTSEKYQNLQQLTIKMKINGSIETHKLTFDRKESLNTLLKVKDWKYDKKRETKAYYLSEYYGLMFTENFEQWNQDIELLLKESDSKEYAWADIFNLPITYVDKYPRQRLRGYLNLSVEDYRVYLSYLNMAIEKGLIENDYLDKMLP